MTSDSASAGRNTSVSPYEAERTAALRFGSSEGRPGSGGQRTRRTRPPALNSDPVRTTRTGTPRARATAIASSRSGPVAARRRVEHRAHSKLPNDVRGATHVVALGMRQYERREGADTHSAQLVGDVRLRWPLIDQDARARRLQQDGVALSHVEEGHPEAGRRMPRGSLAEATTRLRLRRARGLRPRLLPRSRDRRAAGRRWRPSDPAQADREGLRRAAVRAPTCAPGNEPKTRATSSSQAAAHPASHASAVAASGETGSAVAARSPRPSTAGAAGKATAFAGTV